MFQLFAEVFNSKEYPFSQIKTETTYPQIPTVNAPILKWLRQRLLSISLEEATFARRKFRGGDIEVQQHLEQIGRIFLQGYQAAITFGTAQGAIANDNPETLISHLSAVEAEWRGFAYEGAAMGLALLDNLTPWKRNRVEVFLAGAGAEHSYMVHMGVGWVLARLHRPIEEFIARLDPLLGWLAIDGYGFYEGYFHWKKYVKNQVTPRGLSGYALRAFDQGLGRSLWFVDSADVTCLPFTLYRFDPVRRADLWSGIGLACAYAGGVNRAALESLRIASSEYWPQLAQGVLLAAKARARAGNPAAHTELACQVLCGMSSEAAAQITDMALKNLQADGALPAYEVWRQRIQSQFAASEVYTYT